VSTPATDVRTSATDVRTSAAATRIDAAWEALRAVEDPEIPVVSIVDLGLIRYVRVSAGGTVEVGLSPTYVGCPATAVIRRSVCEALTKSAAGDFTVSNVLSPAWSSDWITPDGRRKLNGYGIAPPVPRSQQPIACPRCRSLHTETVSEFGSTPCKALHRCLACLEPFDYFKCI
jgi:ring-1,2-phenylacetyl-CoA epoxidase subunit PaaD